MTRGINSITLEHVVNMHTKRKVTVHFVQENK